MSLALLRVRPDLLPSISIALGGALWGLFWLPLRALGERGLEGAWPGAVLYATTIVALAPCIPLRWSRYRESWRPLLVSGLFTGTAFACYATSILLTDVVRAILLFYLTPAWATLLGLVLLGERLTKPRLWALLLGFSGMLVVFGLGVQIPWPRNLGDWLALASGLAWAYGSLRLYQMGPDTTIEQMMSFVVGGLFVIVLALWLAGPLFGATPPLATLAQTLPFGFLVVIYVLPMLFLTIWPATLLSPGRIGILLMGEIVVGVGSAAWLSGEAFGLRELTGTLMILAAGGVEVFGRHPEHAPEPASPS